MTTSLAVIIVVVALVVVLASLNIFMRRRGYSIPGATVVRCSKGHLFKTTWIEGTSFHAIKLGPRTRYQHCPIGNHWAVVHPVKDEDLTEDDRRTLADGRGVN